MLGQRVQGTDVRALHLLVDRRDQLRRTAQLHRGCRKVGDDVQAAGLRVEGHGRHAPGEFGHDCGEDGVEVGEGVSAGGGGGHAALGHHHADGRTEPERLAAISAHGSAGVPLGLLRLGGAVFLRCFPGRVEGLAGEVDAAQFAGHAITGPVASLSSGRPARPGSRSVQDAGLRAGAADHSCSCFSHAASRCSARAPSPSRRR
ncbi:hypothetical protein ACIQRC_34815 [Streptomyces californicus]|uniref:hypothetical protein n=1 Tax=Streptomyces californicus TaxID=67351 RepID=UPI0038309310